MIDNQMVLCEPIKCRYNYIKDPYVHHIVRDK